MLVNLLGITEVLSTIGSILVAVLVLLATITVHEFGHYIVGKIFKFKINEFAIGMGPAFFKKNLKNGEVFSLRVFPLGGFCAFEGEDEDDETVNAKNQKLQEQGQDDKVFEDVENAEGTEKPENKEPIRTLSENAFNNKKPWQRILVLLAGATVNLLFAIIIVIINFSIFGHTSYALLEIREGEYAEYSLQKGDVITAIDGKFIYHSVDMITSLQGKKKNDIVTIDVVRNDQKVKVDVMLKCDVNAEDLTDYNDVFCSLGIGAAPNFITMEGSPIPSGRYLLRFNDNKEYSSSTRIYDLESFFEYLSKFSDGETVQVWVTTEDGTNREIIDVAIPAGFSACDKTDLNALKALFGIEKEGKPSYQITTVNTKLSFGELTYRPIVYSFKTIGLTFKSLFGLFNGSVPLNSVTGPIGTISLTAQYVGLGFNYLLEIIGLIGISVAIFNLLPIPALDGARAIFVAIEWVRGKPINRNVEGWIHTIGLFLILAIAIFFDILQFI